MVEFIKFDDIMEEMNINDPERYKQIDEGARQRIAKIKKKRGGARANAGRKTLYKNGTAKIHKKISSEARTLLEELSKKAEMTESIFLDALIKTASQNEDLLMFVKENAVYKEA